MTTLVRLVWNHERDMTQYLTRLLKQTPDGDGYFDGIQFTMEPVEQCDYLIVINFCKEKITVNCPPENVWKMISEPPQRTQKNFYWDDKRFERIYLPVDTYQGSRYHYAPTVNFWMVDDTKSYTEVVEAALPEKDRNVVWVTSDMTYLPGHKKRMQFLTDITGKLEFELYGVGGKYVRKWDVCRPSRYTLAIENGRYSHWWTEKIADAFLCYSMPIYYGATAIADFFPEGSYISIDIEKPDEAIEIINQAIADDLYTRNFDKILEARRIYLEKYIFAAYYGNKIKAHQSAGVSSAPRKIELRPHLQRRLMRLAKDIIPDPILEYRRRRIAKSK